MAFRLPTTLPELSAATLRVASTKFARQDRENRSGQAIESLILQRRTIFRLDSLCPTPAARMRGKITMNTLSNNLAGAASAMCGGPSGGFQLELSFGANAICHPAGQQPRRPGRAAWWFRRMRQIVDSACEWRAALPARPEQIWLPDACRTPSLSPRFTPRQHQVCE